MQQNANIIPQIGHVQANHNNNIDERVKWKQHKILEL